MLLFPVCWKLETKDVIHEMVTFPLKSSKKFLSTGRSWLLDPGSWFLVLGSWVMDPGSLCLKKKIIYPHVLIFQINILCFKIFETLAVRGLQCFDCRYF